MLHFVPVDSFGCSILVIEDDKSMTEMSTMKQLQGGITVVTVPMKNNWPNKISLSLS